MIINLWTQRILKAICGGFTGTVFGLIAGAMLGYALVVTHSYNEALGSQDVQAMAVGFTAIALCVICGCLGFLVGAATALILDVRATRRRSFSQASLSEHDFI